MKRKSFVLLNILLACSSLVYADNDVSSNPKTCEQAGGKVIELRPLYEAHTGIVYGAPKEFCQFNNLRKGGLNEIMGLDAFEATTPNFAETFVKKLKILPLQKLPTKPFNDPALNVCLELGGSEVEFTIPEGAFVNNMNAQMDMCVFGDGSSISAWSLAYAARFPLLSKLRNNHNSEPLDISIPNITSN